MVNKTSKAIPLSIYILGGKRDSTAEQSEGEAGIPLKIKHLSIPATTINIPYRKKRRAGRKASDFWEEAANLFERTFAKKNEQQFFNCCSPLTQER